MGATNLNPRDDFWKMGMGLKCVHIPVQLNGVCREKNPHDYQENRRIIPSSVIILIKSGWFLGFFKYDTIVPLIQMLWRVRLYNGFKRVIKISDTDFEMG